jgi:hypothetical protein
MAKKEIKKIYTVNVKPSIMDKIKEKADANKRSLSGEVEFILENVLKATS